MKAGTGDNPKTKSLAAILQITRRDAIGLLELLWEFTIKYAPQGDVGSWTDAEIAEAVDWDGDPELLIVALLSCGGSKHYGFFEKHPEHRLIIHDWAQHAPDYIYKRLKRQGLEFVQTMAENVCRSADNGGQNPPTQPNPTQPCPTQPNPTPQGERREGFAEFLEKGVPEGCDPLDANPLDPGPGLPNKLNQEAKWEPEDFCEEAWAVFRELEKLGSVWLGCVRTLHRKTGKTLGQIVDDAIKTHGAEWTRMQIWDRTDGYFYAKGFSAIKTPAGLAGMIYQRNTEASLSRSNNSETDQDRAAQRMADEILGRKSNG